MRSGAVVRALASRPTNVARVRILASTPYMYVGLSLSLVLVLAPRGFSPCILVFPLLKNKHFQIPFRFSLLYLKIDLKGHSQLWDRADLDTSFASLKSVHLNLKLNVRVGYI